MRDYIAAAARVLLNVSGIFGWVLLGMILVYSAGGAFTKADLAIIFALAAGIHLALIKASHLDHFTINVTPDDPCFDELLRRIREEDNET
jgi:hypothetical protein